MELNNNSLALLLLVAIVVSIAGTMVSLNKLSSGVTGYAVSNGTGTASVSVISNTVLRFAISSIDFGTGYVNTTGGFTNCTMSINGTGTTTITQTGCAGFNTTAPSGPFVLENAGTTYLNVTINSSTNSTGFIGGTNPLYQYAIFENETNSCATSPGTTWTNTINQTNINICQNLSYIDSTDSLGIGIRIAIPYNSNTGARTATFLALGTSLS